MGGVFASLDRDDNVLAIGLNRAVDLLAKKMASVRALGPHPVGGEPVLVRKGRFGPYAQHGNRVANLPRGRGHGRAYSRAGGGAAGREGQDAEAARGQGRSEEGGSIRGQAGHAKTSGARQAGG